MTDPRSELGLLGERLAESFLRREGLKTLARRFSTPVGELDLVMHAGETIVFVEVKTLRSSDLKDPRDQVGSAKRRRMSRAALWFLRHKRWEDQPCRFDVVGIVLPETGAPQIEHIADAFQP